MDSFASVSEVTERFSKDKYFRQWMKCGSADPNSDEYKRGLARALAIEAKSIADAAKSPGHFDAATSPAAGDKISYLLKHNSVMVA